MTAPRPTPGMRRGFTLIEILIVVVILGILATIVLATFRGTTEDAERTAFLSSGRIFSDAALRYWIDNRAYLEDASSGVLPAGFEPYVLEPPIEVELSLKHYRPVELLDYLPNVERVGSHTVRFVAEDMEQVSRFLTFVLNFRVDLQP